LKQQKALHLAVSIASGLDTGGRWNRCAAGCV
jgi:hypothetical protein